MKKLYLILAIIGFILPNYFVFHESVETGNWLLWLDPMATIKGAFANRISSAFLTDLLWIVPIFFIWSYREAKQLGIKKVWIYWLLTMLFGLAGSFPLFLWAREKAKAFISE